MFYYERQAKKRGFSFVVGVDEAGRGPLAGPVVAGAVCLTSQRFHNRVDDSKQLTPGQRQKAFFEIYRNAAVGVGIMSERVIDRLNIAVASRLAMEQAVANLFYVLKKTVPPESVCLLIDGIMPLELPYASKTIVGGDAKSLSIACASIIAKVIRDRIMCTYHKVYPHYHFHRHKGYGTREHFQAIRTHGFCPIHRMSFYPFKGKAANNDASTSRIR